MFVFFRAFASVTPAKMKQPVRPVLQTKDTVACVLLDSKVVIVDKVRA